MKLTKVNEFVAKNKVDDSTPYRQKFHIMSPVGLINDPNGFCHYKGKYHLFYQTHPFKPYHGDKYWAQLVSEDLVNWDYKGIMLGPEHWFEKDGCFSGNTFVEDDKMYLYYTGNIWENGVEFDVGEEYQCLVISEDGENFEKLGKPIIDLPDLEVYSPHYRDPKVWKKDDTYYLIVGAQLRELKPRIVLYSSPNLFDWEKKSVLLEASEGEHGKAYMWECPGYAYIEDKDVLFICPQGMAEADDLKKNRHQSGYVMGTIDYETGKFKTEVDYQLLDYGFEFYAPQIMTDEQGRHLCIGWMGLPDEEKHPTIKDNWVHCLTLPTELVMKNDKLYRKPVPELKELRQNEIILADNNTFKANSYEMIFEFSTGSDATLHLRSNDNMSFFTKLSYDSNKRTIKLDRNQSRADFDGTRTVKLQDEAEKVSLHLFVDRSSVEVFVNEGEYVLTARIFPTDEDLLNKIAINSNELLNMEIWELG